ncbi:MAG: hypothetical protein KOO62_06920 [candidate division Zixibacteria bacterium]|nr:hypothetical protein [candidate division Zixibacteria bacterium]
MFKIFKIGKKLGLGLVISMVLLLVAGASNTATAQDFDALLKAIDKIELNLQSMVKQEAELRKQEIADLRQEMKGVPSGSAGAENEAMLIELALNVKVLQSEVQQLKTAKTEVAVSESDLLAVAEDIAFLRSELGLLRTEVGETRAQYASLDDEGFYVSPEADPKLAELSNRLDELQTSLEGNSSSKTGTTNNSASIGHGDISLGGIVHQHYYHQGGEDETSSFQSKMARLMFQGSINQYANVVIHGEFATAPKLILGYLTFSPVKNWSFSMGQLKPPFGSEFLSSPAASPFVNGSMAKSLGTGIDIGANISFRAKPSRMFGVKATMGLYNGAGINTSDGNNHKNFALRSEFMLADMFTVAPNLIVGKTNELGSAAQNIDAIGATLKWVWWRETVSFEYIRSKIGGQKKAGWYMLAGHSIPTSWTILPKIQLLARYEQYDADLDVNDNRINRITFGTNLFVDSKYTKLQLNYQINTEESTSVANNEFVARFQVVF